METEKEVKKEVTITENKKETLNKVEVEIRNNLEVIGVIDTEPTPLHEIKHEKIYNFILKIPRKSKDKFDYMYTEVPERVCNLNDFKKGDRVFIKGQFRSLQVKDNIVETLNTKNKTHTYIFIEDMVHDNTTRKINELRLHGFICKEPNLRVTPKGREVCDLLVAVRRKYNRSDYIPCVTWNRDARFTSTLKVGSPVYIRGRVQSRDYIKKLPDDTQETRTVYEVSVTEVVEIDSKVTEVQVLN